MELRSGTNNILTFWKERFLSAVRKHTYLFEQSKISSFRRDSDIIPVHNEGRRKRPLIIVGREHYQEIERHYPIDSETEVKKLLKLEYQGHRVIKNLERKQQGGLTARLWVLNDDVPRAFLYLPISVLFGFYQPDNTVVEYNKPGPKSYFVLRRGERLWSSFKTNLINNSQYFLDAIGQPNADVHELPEATMGDDLWKGLIKVPLHYWKSMLILEAPSAATQWAMLKKLALPFSFIWGVYLAIVTIVIEVNGWLIANDLEKHSAKVKKALKYQATLADSYQRYTELSQFLNQQPQSKYLWFVLLTAFENAQITRINYTDGKVVLAGKAESATSFLELLGENERVVNVKFDNPTRSDRGGERFVVSFSLIDSSAARENRGLDG